MLRQELDAITEADLAQLVEASASESPTLVFKLKPPGTSEDDKVELAKDVCAMANADGGDVVFGMAETKSVAAKLIGITDEGFDPLVRRFTQTLEAKLEPRLQGLRFKQVTLAAGGYALVLRVPASFDGPHWIRTSSDTRKFVMRSAVGVSTMTYDQVRSAFDRTAQLATRATEFIERRLDLILARKIPMPIYADRPIFALHVVPMSGLAGRQSVDLRTLADTNWVNFVDVERGGANHTFHFDGLLIHPARSEDDVDGSYTYRHVFRTGAFEASSLGGDPEFQSRPNEQPRKIVWSTDMTKFFMKATKTYLGMAKLWGLAGPAFVSVALLNADGYQLGINESAFRPYSRGVPDRNRLVVPAAWIPDIQSAQLEEVMRPMLDMLWQAFNVSRCLDFDAETGKYQPRRGVV